MRGTDEARRARHGAHKKQGGITPWRLAIPLCLFVAVAGLFAGMLLPGQKLGLPPAPMVGQKPDPFDFAPLDGLVKDGRPVGGLSHDDLTGRISLVNIFASWCAPCREELPVLLALKDHVAELDGAQHFQMAGISYRDRAADSRRLLGSVGNPFSRVGSDPQGGGLIDWGVYGIPETLIFDSEGVVRLKYVGPVTPRIAQDILLVEIVRLLGTPDIAPGPPGISSQTGMSGPPQVKSGMSGAP